ncbi:hypothetical protein CHT97_04735 [Lacticaseibacillus chiayiensis]|nr:hypothetical protein CHT97_04735 [Lacticaseibacillus chiayiensis]
MALTKEQFITEFKDMALRLYAAPIEDLSSQQLYQALALLTRSYIAKRGQIPRRVMMRKKRNRFSISRLNFYRAVSCNQIC